MSYSIRLVTAEDAEFIVNVRNKPGINGLINPTSLSIEDQKKWINEYKIRERNQFEFYYLISENNEKKGLYRLYKINSISFTIGSWIFSQCQDKYLPFYCDLLMGDIGFELLNKKIMLFDIRKKNHKVINYHALKNPLLYSEDEENLYYLIKVNDWEVSKHKVLNFFGISNDMYSTFKQTIDLKRISI